jgi:hypothetical protein
VVNEDVVVEVVVTTSVANKGNLFLDQKGLLVYPQCFWSFRNETMDRL